eukprot:1176461-Prorocentrum_minimum.AAC.2
MALLFSRREFYKTTTVVKYIGSGDNAVPGVALNRSLFQTILRDLVIEGMCNLCAQLRDRNHEQ